MAFPVWFKDKFGPHTLELYEDEILQTPYQLSALRELFGPPDSYPVLDLCCGWGRHAVPLQRMGHTVVGLDGCRYFLERIERKKITRQVSRLELVQGDMRSLPLAGEKFRAVIQMYTSFGYGTDPRDDRSVLGEVYRVLRPGGLYLLDLINWTLARRAFDGKFEESYSNFDIVEDCRIEPGSNLLTVKRAILYRDGRKAHIYSFEIRMFDRETIIALIQSAGLAVTAVWGDFDCSAYSPDKSYRMIMVCRKGGG